MSNRIAPRTVRKRRFKVVWFVKYTDMHTRGRETEFKNAVVTSARKAHRLLMEWGGEGVVKSRFNHVGSAQTHVAYYGREIDTLNVRHWSATPYRVE